MCVVWTVVMGMYVKVIYVIVLVCCLSCFLPPLLVTPAHGGECDTVFLIYFCRFELPFYNATSLPLYCVLCVDFLVSCFEGLISAFDRHLPGMREVPVHSPACQTSSSSQCVRDTILVSVRER